MNSSWLSVPNKWHLWLAATLSGLLLWVGWPVGKATPLLFAAWIPLLWIAFHMRGTKSGFSFFLMVYWACLIWNAGTTWWMYYSTAVGSVVAIMANSLLMTIPWVLFRITDRFAGLSWGYLSLVLYWCAFEYIHLNWEISWPWLTLGNGFAMYPQWIQWYEYTGVFGGTLWILLINIGLFQALWFKRKSLWVASVLGIIIPVLLSYLLFWSYQEKGEPVEMVVVQPNIDPYTEKFIDNENFIEFEQQVDRFVHLSREVMTDSTSFLLWPETAIDAQFAEVALLDPKLINENLSVQAGDLRSLRKIKSFKRQYPHLSLLTGVTSYTIYQNPQEATATARRSGDLVYDMYNTAYFLGDKGDLQTYHKSKLVPGPETMPYPQIFGFLSDLLVDFGGTSGQLGKQRERTVFVNEAGYGLAPAICYESIYGDFMARYVRNGAHFLGIITNDGWWRNTPGHKQHLHYAVLRAIETRRSIARSANTGISGFINQRGEILQATRFWEQDVIKEQLLANTDLTFYARHGDYLGRTAVWLCVLVFLSAWVKNRTTR